jgi:triacylglycerol lipase
MTAAPSGQCGADQLLDRRAILVMVRWIAISAAVLLLAGAATGWAMWRRRRAARRRAGPRALPRHPVVLVHGICGFDEISVFGWKRRYFLGIAHHLERMGVTVYQARLPPLAAVPERAARLLEFIRGISAERVNVIAHSVGGLDTRYAIARLGAADKVASLVTIGTPHHGTPLADLGRIGPALLARAVVKRMGLPSDCLDWLTPARMKAFNAENPDDAGVVYASVICRAGDGLLRRNPILAPTHTYLRQRSGTNDGLVPASSQHWGQALCEIQADHWAQIGWFSARDIRPVYAMIVQHLATIGL